MDDNAQCKGTRGGVECPQQHMFKGKTPLLVSPPIFACARTHDKQPHYSQTAAATKVTTLQNTHTTHTSFAHPTSSSMHMRITEIRVGMFWLCVGACKKTNTHYTIGVCAKYTRHRTPRVLQYVWWKKKHSAQKKHNLLMEYMWSSQQHIITCCVLVY